MKKHITSIFGLIFLTACSSGPGATSYMLGSKPIANQFKSKPIGITRIGVDSVRVPSYAQGKSIAYMNSDNVLILGEDNLWAERPEESIQRSISRGFRELTGIEVIASPYPRSMSADARVQVRFDELIRFEGRALFSGQYIILDGNGREIIRVESFDFSRPMNGQTYSAFVDALNTSLSELIVDISKSLSQ